MGRSRLRWYAYPSCVLVWIVLGVVFPWPFSEIFRGHPQSLFIELGSHALCSHRSPILAASADCICAVVLFLPLLLYAFRPRKWMFIVQVALVAIPIGWWAVCLVAWLSGPHP